MWYTGNGDEGFTGLFGGERIEKDSPRIEALGDLDEATSAIGAARAFCVRAESIPILLHVQHDLYVLMAEVASTNAERLKERIDQEMVAVLEADIAALGKMQGKEFTFIIPGDTRGGALLDLARAVVRRAERHVAGLLHHDTIHNRQLLRYLNRLSSLLYLLARADDTAAGLDAPTTV